MAGPSADPIADGDIDPARFRPYEIVEPLGEGSFATVYLAQNAAVQQRYAIKVLRRHLAADEQERQTFLAEAQLLLGISQDRVVAARHVDGNDEVPWFVMDFAEHGTLDGWVKALRASGTSLTLEQLVGLGVELCECLAALHHYDVVHYDLKPHNVLISSLGQLGDQQRGRRYRLPPDQHLVLGDLGMARTSGRAADRITGTPRYIAPELFEDRGSERSDLFALGLMLYEFAHPGTADGPVRAYDGRRPSNDPRRWASLADVELWGPYRPLGDVRPDLAGRFDDIVRRTVAPDAADRYPDANALRQALEALLRRATPAAAAVRADTVVRAVDDLLAAARVNIARRSDAAGAHEHLTSAADRLRRPPTVAVITQGGAESSGFTLFLAGEPIAARAPAPFGAVVTHLREGDPELAIVVNQRGGTTRVRLDRDRDRMLRADLADDEVRELTLELDHPLGDLHLVDVPRTVEAGQLAHAVSGADLVVVLVDDVADAGAILPLLRDAARRSSAGPYGLIAVDTGAAGFGAARTSRPAEIEDLGFQQALHVANAGLTLRVAFQQMLEGAIGSYVGASAALALCETACMGTNDWAIAKGFIDDRDRLEDECPELRDLRLLREDVRGTFTLPPEHARELRHTLFQPTPAAKLQLRTDGADLDAVRATARARQARWMAALAEGTIPPGSREAARAVVATLRRLQDVEDV